METDFELKTKGMLLSKVLLIIFKYIYLALSIKYVIISINTVVMNYLLVLINCFLQGIKKQLSISMTGLIFTAYPFVVFIASPIVGKFVSF